MKLDKMKQYILVFLSLLIILSVEVPFSSAANLDNWNGGTAVVTLTANELNDARADGLFGPGQRTYNIIDRQIDTSKILRDNKIINSLKIRNLKPETYFDTKTPFYLALIYPAKYRDRIAWDVWIHAQVAQVRLCIPVVNICISADPSPGTIGFNEWFVTDALGNVD